MMKWVSPRTDAAPGASQAGRLVLRRLGLGLVLAALALGGCGEKENTFCSEFHTVDAAVRALRDAKASPDFTRVPDTVDRVASTYEAITPPAELQEDWMSAVEFFRHQAASARSLLSSGQLPETLPGTMLAMTVPSRGSQSTPWAIVGGCRGRSFHSWLRDVG